MQDFYQISNFKMFRTFPLSNVPDVSRSFFHCFECIHQEYDFCDATGSLIGYILQIDFFRVAFISQVHLFLQELQLFTISSCEEKKTKQECKLSLQNIFIPF